MLNHAGCRAQSWKIRGAVCAAGAARDRGLPRGCGRAAVAARDPHPQRCMPFWAVILFSSLFFYLGFRGLDY